MSSPTTANNGDILDLDSWVHAYSYDASGNLTTDTVTDTRGKSYVKTYTYNASNQLVSESRWVAQ